MMDIENLIKPAVDWTGDTWAGRVDKAASLLFCHGYITQAQREKITRVVEKQFADGLASGRIVQKPVAQGMVPREDSRSEAEGVAHQPGPATQDAPNLNPDTSDRLGEG
jgi:hypothetical protein